MIELISATGADERTFRKTPLGLSIDRLRFDHRLVPRIAFLNQAGLPNVYNARIRAESDADLLLFIHDDVWIDDCFITDRVINGLAHFDVIGVAGNRRVPEPHVGWYFINQDWQKDEDQYLSGAVAHGRTPWGPISYYGQWPAPCELLDGVLLAAKRSALIHAGVEFDEAFNFHFYDLDFSRSAHQAGLRLGTWPIAITHASGGSFGTPPWQQALEVYREKWG